MVRLSLRPKEEQQDQDLNKPNFGVDHVFDTPRIQTLYGRGMWPGQNSRDPQGNRFNLPVVHKNTDGVPHLFRQVEYFGDLGGSYFGCRILG